MKYIKVNTPRGRFLLSLRLAAKEQIDATNRYDFFADMSEYKRFYNAEFERLMNEGGEDVIDWMIDETDWSFWNTYATKLDDNIVVTNETFWEKPHGFEIIERVAKTHADVSFSIDAVCPNCHESHDYRIELCEYLPEDSFSVSNIEAELTCESCGEYFIITEIEY